MDQLKKTTRRKFLKTSATIACSAPFLGIMPLVEMPENTDKNLQVFIFSKHLQFLNYEEMAEAAKEIGFDGVDLTIRPKGHVIPESVKDDLPLATQAIKSVGFEPNMFTTNIVNVNDPYSIQVLETTAELGYNLYRAGWLKYKDDISIKNSIDQAHKQLKKLSRLNKKLGLKGAYQNHAREYVGASIWDMDLILDGLSPEYLGCQYDIRHATVEGGSSWQIGLRLIKDHINSIVIKDFKWGKVNGVWKPVNTPLGEGMVDFQRYFSFLKKHQINVPVSMHFEYDLGGAEKGKSKLTIPQKQVFAKMKKDLQYLRNTWEKAV
ncbi:MAG: sugar phosphate isomerase/epimerase [Bacteroidetes bacterium]|nr:MAG: sugar phosphate isomerase/epimerase [Bacteroidota bacterium]